LKLLHHANNVVELGVVLMVLLFLTFCKPGCLLFLSVCLLFLSVRLCLLHGLQFLQLLPHYGCGRVLFVFTWRRVWIWVHDGWGLGSGLSVGILPPAHCFASCLGSLIKLRLRHRTSLELRWRSKAIAHPVYKRIFLK